MFTVIVPPTPSEKGFFRRLFRRFQPPVPARIHCAYPEFTYTLIHYAPYHRPADLITLIYGSSFCELLPADDILLPDKLLPLEIPALPFQQRLAENTVRWLLEQGHTSPYSQRLGIIDADALCLGAAERFVQICPHVKIVTRRMEVYREFAKKMMSEYGAAVMLSDSPESLLDCTVIFCPTDFVWTQTPLRICAPVVCASRCHIAGQNMIIHSLEPILPPEFLCNVPEGISPIRFAQAVYRAMPDCFLKLCRAKSGICSDNRPTMESVAQYIRLNQQKPADNPPFSAVH